MRKTILLLLAFLLVLAVVGCASTSPTPTVNNTPALPDTSATDYPSGVDLNPVDMGYPASGSDYPAPAGAPALDSFANVKVELVEQLDDPANPAQVILRVKLVSATAMNNSPDRFNRMIGQIIDLHANKEGLPSLSSGDTFTADVTYRGDEANTLITAENIQK